MVAITDLKKDVFKGEGGKGNVDGVQVSVVALAL